MFNQKAKKNRPEQCLIHGATLINFSSLIKVPEMTVFGPLFTVLSFRFTRVAVQCTASFIVLCRKELRKLDVRMNIINIYAIE